MNFANFEKWLLINILNLGWWYLSSIVTNSLMYWTMDLAQCIKHSSSKPSPRTVLSKNGATWRNDRSRCIKLSSEKVISKQNSLTNKSKDLLVHKLFPKTFLQFASTSGPNPWFLNGFYIFWGDACRYDLDHFFFIWNYDETVVIARWELYDQLSSNDFTIHNTRFSRRRDIILGV